MIPEDGNLTLATLPHDIIRRIARMAKYSLAIRLVTNLFLHFYFCLNFFFLSESTFGRIRKYPIIQFCNWKHIYKYVQITRSWKVLVEEDRASRPELDNFSCIQLKLSGLCGWHFRMQVKPEVIEYIKANLSEWKESATEALVSFTFFRYLSLRQWPI